LNKGKEIELSNIYVGNLSFRTTEEDLRDAFEAFGEVSSVAIIKDKMTGESRGFGFVEMASDQESQAAIAGLNGTDLGGRALTVNLARPREERSGGGPGGPGGGRSGGFGGQRGGGSGRGRSDRDRRY
jgi:RNA recognition motif-containing protein